MSAVRRYLPVVELDAVTDDELAAAEQLRPRNRRDCRPGGALHIRPCPWVSCRHHIATDVSACGVVQLNLPGVDGMIDSYGRLPPISAIGSRRRDMDALTDLAAEAALAMSETCSLDVADRGDCPTAEALGPLLAASDEAVFRAERSALGKMREALLDLGVTERDLPEWTRATDDGDDLPEQPPLDAARRTP